MPQKHIVQIYASHISPPRGPKLQLKDTKTCNTCNTIRYDPLLHSFSSSGCQLDSSWQGRIHSASVRPRSARARSCQSRPLWEKTSEINAEQTHKTTNEVRL